MITLSDRNTSIHKCTRPIFEYSAAVLLIHLFLFAKTLGLKTLRLVFLINFYQNAASHVVKLLIFDKVKKVFALDFPPRANNAKNLYEFSAKK